MLAGIYVETIVSKIGKKLNPAVNKVCANDLMDYHWRWRKRKKQEEEANNGSVCCRKTMQFTYSSRN
jgi:hypothetical protein